MPQLTKGLTPQLLNKIYQTAQVLPQPFLEKVAEWFLQVDGLGSEHQWAVNISELPKANWRQVVTELITQWHINGTPQAGEAISSALVTARYCVTRCNEESRTEIVWTGPTVPSIAVRRTEQVLLQLIQEAQQELTIMSFAIYRVPELATALLNALDRGVNVKLIAETSDDSTTPFGVEPGLGREVYQRAQVYQWDKQKRPRDEKGNIGSLHAKAAISDRSRLFITSANLTGYALSLNMEVGILISGGSLAAQLTTGLDALIEHNILNRL